jgi:tight adherence protein B
VLDDPGQLITVIQAGSVFGLVISIWLCGMLLWSTRRAKRSRELRKRLGIAPVEAEGDGRVLRLWHEGREATTLVQGGEPEITLRERVEKTMRQADLSLTLPTALISAVGIPAFVFLVILVITGSVIIGLCGDVAVVIVFWILLNLRISRRIVLFERQLIDALELAARSLRAGHPLVGAFRLIADEIPAPVGELFGRVWQQQQLGSPLDQALAEAATESGSGDAKLFSTSVRIQLRSGGNLADMMERLAAVIRERNRLSRRIHVLTAQTQFSKRVLLAMPFLMFVVLNVLNPRYLAPLYQTSAGHIILLIAGATLLVGWWVMNRMAKLSW